ncbi:hypothetical protein [uncultured Parabacteroides sp.]|uniref:hypothetical protein n=1 Tax=uncultured Parabacteroides sp. TaxID=512312 RepID=UPI0025870372|nr:hypothetical protein [uncultured Parabacteroides sp.]
MKNDRPHAQKPLKFPWDIWNAVRFILLQAILQELSFITLTAFSSSDNQIARFLELSWHLISSVVSHKGENRKKSQSKIDQNFGRNRKMVKKGVIVICLVFLEYSEAIRFPFFVPYLCRLYTLYLIYEYIEQRSCLSCFCGGM